jgi:hypothetical protein
MRSAIALYFESVPFVLNDHCRRPDFLAVGLFRAAVQVERVGVRALPNTKLKIFSDKPCI